MPNESQKNAQIPRVSILIPTFNGRHLLAECLPSLSASDYPKQLFDIIVFDNGSSDGTAEFLRQEYPEVKVLRSETNLFFAPAINRAAEHSQSEVVVFLNNDMRVEPTWLPRLLEPLQLGQADCVASAILDWDGVHYQFVGGGINFLGQGFEHGGRVDQMTPEAVPLLFACGGAMAVRRNLFLDTGGFDEDYELLYEDVDFGWRLNLLGYRVVLAPEARVFHRAHASVSRMDVMQRVRILERNALFTIIKNYGDALLMDVLSAALMLAERRAALYAQQANRASLPDKIACLWLRRGRFKHKGEAIHAALDEISCSLPHLMRKRQSVQERRCVSDERVLPLFGDLLRVWAYEEADYALLQEQGYPKLLEQFFTRCMGVLHG